MSDQMAEIRTRILLVEDNPGDARLLQEAFRETGGISVNFTSATTLEGALGELDRGVFDVILLDLGLPDSNGVDTLVKMRDAAASVPVVVLTGLDDTQAAVQAVQEGAQDYIVKGELWGNPLTRSVKYAIERHRMQAELRAYTEQLVSSELRLRTIVQASADGIVIVDAAGALLFANPAAERLFGAARVKLAGTRPIDPIPEGEFSEIGIDRPDGTSAVAELRVADTVWEGHSARVISLRDITERRRAEDALRENEARMSLALDAANMGTWESNLETGEVVWSDSVAQLFGLEPGAFVGTREGFYTFVHPDDRAEVARAAGMSAEGQDIFDVEHRIVWPDGTTHWVRNKGRVIGHEGTGRMFGSVVDVTDRKEAELGLEESRARLNAVVQHLPEGVCMLDDSNRVVLKNPIAESYLQALGHTSAEGRLENLGTLGIEEVLEPRADGLPHETVVGEGSERVFEVAGQGIDQSGAASGSVLVMREVTQERDTQERIQSQYRLAAVGQLAAGIAHDFNNMLTVINGFAQMLQMRKDLPDDVHEDMGMIYTQAQRAAQLIRQILDFSRKSETQYHPIDIVPMLKESIKMLDKVLPETISVVTEFWEPGLVVEASPTQLQQILTNLAVNARDAMRGGGELRVTLSSLDVSASGIKLPPEVLEGEWVAWVVSDTGTGIPPDVLSHVFEPFYSTKAAGEGTGLGLAQCFGLVKQHGGEIVVNSEVGKGTTITIFLPRTAQPADADMPMVEDVATGNGQTVLLVEDDNAVRHTLTDMLVSLNYQVMQAENGVQALEVYDAHASTVDVVLTDVVMPEMGGVELLEALRQRDPDVRLVAMSGYAPDADRKNLMEGISGFVGKPLDYGVVATVMADAVQGKTSRSPLGPDPVEDRTGATGRGPTGQARVERGGGA